MKRSCGQTDTLTGVWVSGSKACSGALQYLVQLPKPEAPARSHAASLLLARHTNWCQGAMRQRTLVIFGT